MMNVNFLSITAASIILGFGIMPAVVMANPLLVDQALADPAIEYSQGEIIVQLKPGKAWGDSNGLRTLGIQSIREIRGKWQGERFELHLAKLPSQMTVKAAIEKLRRVASVQFAEPNYIVSRSATIPNDPFYLAGVMWGHYGQQTGGLYINLAGSGASDLELKDKRCDGSVLVGIVDEGVMTQHPDTAPNIWSNPYEIPGNGIDDDGNGFIDDVHGWDFFHGDSTTFDGAEYDTHGTHVSGTIGAVTGNEVGVAGMCGNLKMISAKFLENRGTLEGAISATDYITDLKKKHRLNIVATNNSWGFFGYSQALKDAVDRAGAQDILVVAAAGNFGVNNDSSKYKSYPASFSSPNVISVAAIDSRGRLSPTSNFGKASVHLAAPGVGIFSTVPTATGASYASFDGTSMAAPHVTGAAAIYASLHPGSTAAQIKDAILKATIPTPTLSRKTVTGGRLYVGAF